MDTLQKNKKTIVIAAGAAVALAGLYFILKKPSQKGPRQPKKPLTEEQRNEIIFAIQKHSDGLWLTPATVVPMLDAIIKLNSPEYTQLTMKNRQLRREVKDNFEKYTRCYEDFQRSAETLIRTTEREMIVKLKITDSIWTHSVNYYIGKSPQIMEFFSDNLAKQIEEIGAHIDLSRSEFVKILKRKTDLLQTEINMVKKFKSLASVPNFAIDITELRIHDLIFDEFGIEEEDFIAAKNKYKNIPEVQSLMPRYQQALANMKQRLLQ